jgi:hypothetical protein
MSKRSLTDKEVLGRLSSAWDNVSMPRHWAYEDSKTLRVLGNMNKIATYGTGGYVSGKLVTNRRGRLAQSGGVALGTIFPALGAHAWNTIEMSFTNAIGHIPGFLKRTALYDMKQGYDYAVGASTTPDVDKDYAVLENIYLSYAAEADRRGILPLNHKYPLESPFGKHSIVQQSLAVLSHAAALAIHRHAAAGKDHIAQHHSLYSKGTAAQIISVSAQEIQNVYESIFGDNDSGYGADPQDNAEFVPSAADAHVLQDNAAIADAANANAIQMAQHYAAQIAAGVPLQNIQQQQDAND